MELLGQNKVDHRQRKVAIISQDSFYKVLTPDQKAKALKGQYNFDHPGRPRLQSGLLIQFINNSSFPGPVQRSVLDRGVNVSNSGIISTYEDAFM